MPQDRKGQELKEGDTVMVPCTVRRVFPKLGEKGNNVEVETVEPHFPYGGSEFEVKALTHFGLNSKQVEKVAS